MRLGCYFFFPQLHFINGPPSQTKSSLVKYDAPSPSQSVLFFESVNMVDLALKKKIKKKRERKYIMIIGN